MNANSIINTDQPRETLNGSIESVGMDEDGQIPEVNLYMTITIARTIGESIAEKITQKMLDKIKDHCEIRDLEPSVGVDEAQRILSCGRQTVHQLCDQGLLPYHWVGNSRRFRKEDFEEYWARVRKNTIDQRTNRAVKRSKAHQNNSQRRSSKQNSGQKDAIGSGSSRKISYEEVKSLWLED